MDSEKILVELNDDVTVFKIGDNVSAYRGESQYNDYLQYKNYDYGWKPGENIFLIPKGEKIELVNIGSSSIKYPDLIVCFFRWDDMDFWITRTDVMGTYSKLPVMFTYMSPDSELEIKRRGELLALKRELLGSINDQINNIEHTLNQEMFDKFKTLQK